MPRNYNRSLATKGYVNRRFEEDKWGSIHRCTLDLDAHVVDGGIGDIFNLYDLILQAIIDGELWTTVTKGTDGEDTWECEFKIKYIRVHLRVATGESETLSAVSQTCRFLIYRTIETYSEAVSTCVTDVDGSPRYPVLFGDINGLWMDKSFYVHSWAADSDTTSGGQSFVRKKIRPLHSDIFVGGSAEGFNPDTEKGAVLMQIVGDDPSGENSQVYGYLEIGFIVKEK